MARLLGCDFNINTLNTKFDDIAVFLDPAHMVKLVRNAFGDKDTFLDSGGSLIHFNLVKRLLIFQEREGCHLTNKLRKNHIFFFKQKMKVKLVSQLLSQSVADTLKFYKYNLGLKEFSDVDGTVQFIEMFYVGFDILNSRPVRCFGKKKPIFNDNIQEIIEFTNSMTTYVIGLKVNDNLIPVLESNRKTSFLGFIVCLNSVLLMQEIKENQERLIPII